jgi:hypothetical protein
MAKTLLQLLSLYGRLGRVVKERELSDWEKGSNYAGEGERGEAVLITSIFHGTHFISLKYAKQRIFHIYLFFLLKI